MQLQLYSPTPQYTDFRTTTTLESSLRLVRHLRDVFKHVGKRTEGCFVVPSSYAITLKNSTQMEKPAKSWRSVVPRFNFQVPSSAS